jgi:hypothetical protein
VSDANEVPQPDADGAIQFIVQFLGTPGRLDGYHKRFGGYGYGGICPTS